MNRIMLFFAAGSFLCTAMPLEAREIILKPGESIRVGETEVVCGEIAVSQPVRLNECQIWDDYEKHCLYERTVFSLDNLVCVEECQHWDSYGKSCFFATSCTFYPSQQIFVRTSCDEFDQYGKKCLLLKEEKLAPGDPVSRKRQ